MRPFYIHPLSGSNGVMAKFTSEQVIDIRRLYHHHGYNMSELSRQFKVCQRTISNMVKGTTYSHVTLIPEKYDSNPLV